MRHAAAALLFGLAAAAHGQARTPSAAADVVAHALALLGTPYRYGGDHPATGFDCSGLVRHVYGAALGREMPRRSEDLGAFGRPVPSRLAHYSEVEALADVLKPFPFGVIGHSPDAKLHGIGRTPDDELLSRLSIRGGAKVNWNNLAYTSHMPDLWKDNLSASEHAAQRGAEVYAIYNPGSLGIMRIDFIPNALSNYNWVSS